MSNSKLKIQNNIQTTAKKVLKIEAESINSLINNINADFEKCVKDILKLKGRVVVTGIGKSAIIANKIVATLNSTGTPAVFMHAADAIHGDLGTITKSDLVICISKSGNTPEIKVLVPLLKRIGIPLAALVSDTQSFLALNSKYVLNAFVKKEADPNNLAPTSSTTAALAMGDALAMCLLEARSFSKEDFANFHPGGSLGKKLYLKVNDLIANNQVPQVLPDANLKEIIMEITSKRLGATAVISKKGTLEGIITDGDLRRMMNNFTRFEKLKASEIMTKNPKTITEGAYAVEAMELMQNKNITQLIVLDSKKKLKGFIHLHDILKEGIV
jgi:arabinose-5-phosphate isomerase